MTLSSTIPKEINNGNDATVVFSFAFIINLAADIVVTHTDALGVETVITEGTGTTNYSISVANYPGTGSITYPATLGTELATGAKLTLSRSVALSQETDLQNQAQYKPQTVESTFDKSRMIDLQQQEQIDRSIKAPISDSSGANYTLPVPTADTVIGVWNGAGTAIVMGPTVSAISGANASAIAAEASATAAAGSETNAGASETSAAASAVAAAAVLDSAFFRDTKSLTNADSPYTLLATDNGLFFSVDTSGGAVVVNLVAMAGLTLPFNMRFKKETADVNSVTINCGGTDEFNDGQTSKTIENIGGIDLVGDDSTAPDSWKTARFGASIGQMVVDNFSEGAGFTAGTSTTLTLSQDPGNEQNGVLTFDGLTIHHDDYSVAGTTLTYTGDATIPTGTLKAEFRYGATAPIGTPSDNTVTTVKLVDGNVTFPKLASAAIASQAEAEAGTATDKLMTPEQTKQAVTALAPTRKLLHVQDQKASGTGSGTFSSGADRTRTLNTVLTNEIAGASLSSNAIILPAGNYYIEGLASAFRVNEHQSKIYNVTAGADLIIGTGEFSGSGANYTASHSIVTGAFTLAVTSSIELRHRCSTSRSSNGLGATMSFGDVGVFADVKVWTY